MLAAIFVPSSATFTIPIIKLAPLKSLSGILNSTPKETVGMNRLPAFKGASFGIDEASALIPRLVLPILKYTLAIIVRHVQPWEMRGCLAPLKDE